jgi:phosphoribosylcarboxyaminoimidazole (NCAIR) mutase
MGRSASLGILTAGKTLAVAAVPVEGAWLLLLHLTVADSLFSKVRMPTTLRGNFRVRNWRTTLESWIASIEAF